MFEFFVRPYFSGIAKIDIYQQFLSQISLVLPKTNRLFIVDAVRALNFPQFQFRMKEEKNRKFIYDEIRAKYVFLSPEEWVRQHCVRFLVEMKNAPKGLVSVEKGISLNGKHLRYDAAVYSKQGNPLLLVECKAPDVPITQDVFNQIATYNMLLKVPFLWVSNGLSHFFCEIDFNKKTFSFLKELPSYQEMGNRAKNISGILW